MTTSKIIEIIQLLVDNPVPSAFVSLTIGFSIWVAFQGLANFIHSFPKIFIKTNEVRKSQSKKDSNNGNINIIDMKESNGSDSNASE